MCGPAPSARRSFARALLHLLAGLLLAAAIGTKQPYGFVALTAAAWTLAAPQLPSHERWRGQFLPLAAGGVLPMLPLIAAAPDNFLYAVSEFHRTHHLWWGARMLEEETVLSSFAVRAHARREGFACFRLDLRGGQADHAMPGPAEFWVAPSLARVAPDCG